MPAQKIVVVSVVLDQGDVLGDFIEWNLHLGVDLILVQDLGSSDGSHALLEEFAQKGRVQWFIAPEKDMKKYKHGGAPAKSARDSHGADWIVLCDADEFLCPVGADLRTILRDADDRQVTLLKAPCLNMTGPKIEPGQSATEALTLRIDKPSVELAIAANPDDWKAIVPLPSPPTCRSSWRKPTPGWTPRSTPAIGDNPDVWHLRCSCA